MSCAADVSCLAAAGIFRSKCVRELNFDEASLLLSSLPHRPFQLSVRGMESRLQHQAIIVRGGQAKIRGFIDLWNNFGLLAKLSTQPPLRVKLVKLSTKLS